MLGKVRLFTKYRQGGPLICQFLDSLIRVKQGDCVRVWVERRRLGCGARGRRHLRKDQAPARAVSARQ